MTTGTNIKSVRLILDSNLEDVFLVGLAIRGICSYVPLGEVAAYQVEVCVVEAVNNAIKHAYGNEAGHRVEICVEVRLDRIVFEVCDDGAELGNFPKMSGRKDFDPEDLENIPEGGMGLQIIYSVMDEVTYARTDRGNVLRMSKSYGPDRCASAGEPK